LTKSSDVVPHDGKVCLRIERKHRTLKAMFSSDGKTWSRGDTGLTITTPLSSLCLPETVKVGVYAESSAPGTWKVEFDRFKLSRPDE
jgi:regulation of enolase protein 1 (concanavalin A-like superfamily)